MDSNERAYLRLISKDQNFLTIIERMTKNEVLTNPENTMMLSLAIFLLNCYKVDRRRTTLLEFAYYIILKYSINNRDYAPLLDLATNLGYFPISSAIMNFTPYEGVGIDRAVLELKLSQFNVDGITQTLQQRNASSHLLRDESYEKLYVAPTSFGKSSLIAEYIKGKLTPSFKVAVITPTKSLLHQTYRMIRDLKMSRKIILHDEMYDRESTFIAVLTQERALRLVNRYNITLDALIIDEAHNLLDSDHRSILLTRLLKICKNGNSAVEIMYLSPLLNSVDAIKTAENQQIAHYHIRHNIKEPEISLLNKMGEIKKYNRFVDKYFDAGKSSNPLDYIKAYSLNKNFIYTNRPPRVESLAIELRNSINTTINDSEIIELKNILSKIVHPQYYLIDCLDSGVIFIHGKTPDLLKDYLEHKFKSIKSIKYLVANSVILEGINLPIDSLFILNVWGLHGKDLTNLIGRVNRLDAIFDGSEKSLGKLLPAVHFVHASGHMQDSADLEKRVSELRSTVFDDIVENPTLAQFSTTALQQTAIEKVKEILKQESIATAIPDTKSDGFKKRLIEEGISTFYRNFDEVSGRLYLKAEAILHGELPDWDALTIVDKIYELFVRDYVDEIVDYEFRRLRNDSARKYYKNFISVKRKLSLSQNIAIDVAYLLSLKTGDNPFLYFGKSFGEVPYKSKDYLETKNPVYIDLSGKTESQIVNLAVVKNKIETDFVSYKINRFVVFMLDAELISREEYLQSIYGTTNEKLINLTRSGLSLNLISRLESDKQLRNLELTSDGEIVGNSEFSIFANKVDDFYRFELSKYITWVQHE